MCRSLILAVFLACLPCCGAEQQDAVANCEQRKVQCIQAGSADCEQQHDLCVIRAEAGCMAATEACRSDAGTDPTDLQASYSNQVVCAEALRGCLQGAVGSAGDAGGTD